ATALAAEALRPRYPAVAPTRPAAGAPLDVGLIDAMLAGLPDPVVALDRDGIVVAFNRRAAGLAPALRRGARAWFALRMPEVVAAIRQAIASGQPQGVEFTERVPVDRWYEAHVTILHALKDAAERRIDLVLMTVRDLTPLHRVEEMRADFV